MADPNYVYRPLSEETKGRMRAAAQKRLGIPDGYCQVYDVLVPLEDKALAWRLAARIRYRLERKLGLR